MDQAHWFEVGMNSLTRAEKLRVYQIGYSLWQERYPTEEDDSPGNHLFEMQLEVLKEALAAKGISLSKSDES